jgi:hypothetical protein
VLPASGYEEPKSYNKKRDQEGGHGTEKIL